MAQPTPAVAPAPTVVLAGRSLSSWALLTLVFATGLTIVGTWVAFGLLAAWLAPQLMGGGSGMLSALFTALRNTGYLLAFVFYFLAGYLLYAAVLVAIGSVCNTLKEAQNLMQPVMMLLMVPLLSMVFVAQEPNGLVAKAMSFFPLFTPFTMMNRAGGPPATWEYVATSALLLDIDPPGGARTRRVVAAPHPPRYDPRSPTPTGGSRFRAARPWRTDPHHASGPSIPRAGRSRWEDSPSTAAW